MITAFVLVNRETHEKYREIYVDCSMLRVPLFSDYAEAEKYRRSLDCGAYLETIQLKMTERRYHELSRIS